MRFLAAARSRRTVAVGALLAASLIGGPAAGLASAQMGDAHPVAAPSASGLELSFAPRVADGILLTVAGPGLYAMREFAPGAPPSFVLVGAGGPLPDGRYKYELRSQPVVDQRLREIATENDDEDLIRELAREEEELTLVQAGRFEIRGGSIVLTKREPEPEPEIPLAAGAHHHGGETHTHDH